MNSNFEKIILQLPILLNALIESKPVKNEDIKVGVKGIYLFSEQEVHLYAGRSNDIKKRIQRHCRLSSKQNSAAFAFRIAREETHCIKATYKTEGSRKMLEKDPTFIIAFKMAKERIKKMELRYIDINDPILQSIFEIYVAVTLRTKYNDFENH